MSLAEIEAELPRLSAGKLRQLALKSWSAFAEKEGRATASHEVSEDDPALLTALDEATTPAESSSGQGVSGDQVRSRIAQWISKPIIP